MSQIKLLDFRKGDRYAAEDAGKLMQQLMGRSVMTYREWFGETATYAIFLYHKEGDALSFNAMGVRVNPLDFLQVDYERMTAAVESDGTLTFCIIQRDGQAIDLVMTLWSASAYQSEMAPLLNGKEDRLRTAQRLYVQKERHVDGGWLRGLYGLPRGDKSQIEKKIGIFW